MLTMCLDKFVWRWLMEVNAFPLDRLLCELCRRVWSEVGRTLDCLNSGLMNALNGHWQVAKDACNLVIRNKTARITTAKILFFSMYWRFLHEVSSLVDYRVEINLRSQAKRNAWEMRLMKGEKARGTMKIYCNCETYACPVTWFSLSSFGIAAREQNNKQRNKRLYAGHKVAKVNFEIN